MRDVQFSFFMVALLALVSAIYTVRTMVRGRARHARTEADGGSVFVGKPVMEMGYWLFRPVIGMLRRLGVTPNMVTGFSLVPGLAAGVAAACGRLGLACLLAAFSALCDLVDGLLARELKCGSDAGELFDASVDRYVEAFLTGGLAIHFRDDAVLLSMALLALFGGFMVSYTTAKAEALSVASPRGAMRRAERAIYVISACGLTPIFGLTRMASSPNRWMQELPICAVMTFVALVSNVSVIQRLLAIARSLRARDLSGVRQPQEIPAPQPERARPVDALVGGTQNPARIA